MSWLVLTLGLLSLDAPLQAPAPPARANLWIDVTALDRRDMPVGDLRPEEFEVWISGYRVPITDVVAVSPSDGVGRTVVVVLDDMAVPPTLAPRVREAARALVDGMKPEDRVAVTSIHDPVLELTADRAKLIAAITRYNPRPFPFRIEDAGEHVLRAVARIARQLAEQPGRRKTIVAVGVGWLFDTPLPPPGFRDLRPVWIEAIRAMAATHTALYVIDPGGLGTAPRGYFGGESGFARETGGYAFLNTNDLRRAAERIWQEAGSYYLLGVVNPPIQQKADLRELEVKVLRKDVTVRARREIAGGM